MQRPRCSLQGIRRFIALTVATTLTILWLQTPTFGAIGWNNYSTQPAVQTAQRSGDWPNSTYSDGYLGLREQSYRAALVGSPYYGLVRVLGDGKNNDYIPISLAITAFEVNNQTLRYQAQVFLSGDESFTIETSQKIDINSHQSKLIENKTNRPIQSVSLNYTHSSGLLQIQWGEPDDITVDGKLVSPAPECFLNVSSQSQLGDLDCNLQFWKAGILPTNFGGSSNITAYSIYRAIESVRKGEFNRTVLAQVLNRYPRQLERIIANFEGVWENEIRLTSLRPMGSQEPWEREIRGIWNSVKAQLRPEPLIGFYCSLDGYDVYDEATFHILESCRLAQQEDILGVAEHITETFRMARAIDQENGIIVSTRRPTDINTVAQKQVGQSDRLEESVKDSREEEAIYEVASLLIGFFPVVGTANDWVSAATGVEQITQKELEDWERVLILVPILGSSVRGARNLTPIAVEKVDSVVNALRRRIDNTVGSGSSSLSQIPQRRYGKPKPASQIDSTIRQRASQLTTERQQHILDRHSPRRTNGQQGGKFPEEWSDDDIINRIQEVVNSSRSLWSEQIEILSDGSSRRSFRVDGVVSAQKIRVITNPESSLGIVTAFPRR